MAELELHQIARPYARLRIIGKRAGRSLLSSLANDGQLCPVLVVEGQTGRYVLIDGYQRFEALKKLGRETIQALVLELDEPSALIFRHRQQGSRGSSALEDAWLLAALMEQHRLDQSQLACRLGHHQSWVSRRLGLLTTLPKSVQQLVRQGRLSPYLASKYLLPMARAMSDDCEKVAKKIADQEVTTRQMEKFYVAWRACNEEGRARLVDDPVLFVRASAEMEREEPPQPDAALVKDIELLGTISRRVSRRLSRRSRDQKLPVELQTLWPAVEQSFKALSGQIEERKND